VWSSAGSTLRSTATRRSAPAISKTLRICLLSQATTTTPPSARRGNDMGSASPVESGAVAGQPEEYVLQRRSPVQVELAVDGDDVVSNPG
jgi:hypothetical protein